jgi:DNA-binding transcriptional LysR family regulator
MAELPAMLGEGGLDVGFVRLPMRLPAGLSQHLLVRDQFCLALCADHPLAAASGPIRAAQLAAERFIAPEQEAGTHEVARRGRFSPQLAGAPGSLAAVLAQVSLGAGVSVLPSVAAGVVRMPNVAFRPLAGQPIPSEIAAIYRTREPAPAVARLIAQLVETAAVEMGTRALS